MVWRLWAADSTLRRVGVGRSVTLLGRVTESDAHFIFAPKFDAQVHHRRSCATPRTTATQTHTHSYLQTDVQTYHLPKNHYSYRPIVLELKKNCNDCNFPRRGVFWNLFKTVIKNKFLAGSIPVIKSSLFRFKTNYCEIICQGCFHRVRTKE